MAEMPDLSETIIKLYQAGQYPEEIALTVKRSYYFVLTVLARYWYTESVTHG